MAGGLKSSGLQCCFELSSCPPRFFPTHPFGGGEDQVSNRRDADDGGLEGADGILQQKWPTVSYCKIIINTICLDLRWCGNPYWSSLHVGDLRLK